MKTSDLFGIVLLAALVTAGYWLVNESNHRKDEKEKEEIRAALKEEAEEERQQLHEALNGALKVDFGGLGSKSSWEQ